MAQSTRRRTAAQRQVETDDVRPISEEEQEAEITALRKKNAEDGSAARLYLDIMITVCVFVSGRQLLRYISAVSDTPLLLITATQTLLLPLSLSPSRLPVDVQRYHPMVMGLQVVLFMLEFVFIRDPAEGLTAELLRWALPELAAGAVEVQRRAELSSEVALAKLEKLKYPLKGA